jgi:RimJ/RimL family protein N-acetyltransferase
MKVVIETPRLILREFQPRDADALARVISDPETMRFYPAPFDPAGVEGWITRNIRRYEKNGHGLWALDLKATGEMIGDCGITLQEVDGEFLPELGYHLRRDMSLIQTRSSIFKLPAPPFQDVLNCFSMKPAS